MELNPNHPVTQAVHDHWHKICALVMVKLGVKQVEITSVDIDAIQKGVNIILHDTGASILVSLVDDATVEYLAKREGGLPN